MKFLSENLLLNHWVSGWVTIRIKELFVLIDLNVFIGLFKTDKEADVTTYIFVER